MKNAYTSKEELFNSITHGVGIGLAVIGSAILVILAAFRGSVEKIVSFGVYGLFLTLMFLSSTLYHSFRKPKWKGVFRVFDHVSIFLCIAGTYTPILILTLSSPIKWIVLAGIWIFAIAGSTFKIFTKGKYDKYKLPTLLLYIGMGWFAIFPVKQIVTATSWAFFAFILGGGLFYSIGTIFYSIKKIPYNHGIWHIFVLFGSLFHFLGIAIYLS